MVTGMTVTVRARNRTEMQKQNFRICRAISTLNHGAWYLDRRTRGNVFASRITHVVDKSPIMTKTFRKQKPHCYPKARRFAVGYCCERKKKFVHYIACHDLCNTRSNVGESMSNVT